MDASLILQLPFCLLLSMDGFKLIKKVAKVGFFFFKKKKITSCKDSMVWQFECVIKFLEAFVVYFS
jgi:hypothetical protein